MVEIAGELLGTTILFFVPGLALLLWLLPDQELDWFEWLSLSAGLSLSVFPLLFMWARVIGDVSLGPFALWGILGICILLIVWRLRNRADIRCAVRDTPLWYSLLLILVAGTVIGVRLLAIRGLTVPLWGDSVQHAVIAQLLVENGGLFDSWLPYAPYQSLTVHFGFHAVVAAFQWATGMEVAQATLVVGQIVNSLAVLTVYPLAMRIGGRGRWAGIGALWVIGLLSSLSAFYVNWGRYPQLAGQAILPVALWLAIEAIDPARRGWGVSVLAGIAAAGMSLAYYRMPFYYGVFVLIWLTGYVLRLRWDRRTWLNVITHLLLIAAVSAALLLPWVKHIAGGELASGVISSTAAVPPVRRVLAEYFGWLQITTYFPWWLLVLAGIAVIWSIVRREWRVTGVGLWVVGLAALPAGRLIHLPGATHMQIFAILIALYIPIAILVGWLLGEATSWLLDRHRTLGYVGLLLMPVLSLGWGINQQVSIVDLEYAMVTEADRAAMDWIRANTPEDSRFLVNGFLIYGGRSAVGADAGWWIPLLAGRQNTMPPQYALMNEAPNDPSYNQDVINLVAQLQELPLSTPAGLSLLCQQDISHIYVGQGQGRVGLGAVPLYTVSDMLNSPAFTELYHQDQVWVFAFDRSTCPAGVEDPD